MNCPWTSSNQLVKKVAIGSGLFILSVFVLSVVIKLIAIILDLLSMTPILNTLIVIAATVIILLLFCQCYFKSKASSCHEEVKK